MADILIRGIEMPKTCSQCPMCQDYVMCKLNSFAFWNTNNPFDFRNERLAGCPIVELPEHGDLIDRDEYIAMMESNCNKSTALDSYTFHVCRGDVKTMPVIVPSNKEDADGN